MKKQKITSKKSSKIADEKKSPYGYELILDLHQCDTSKFNRESIAEFFKELCVEIDMIRCELHFWDDSYLPEGQTYDAPHTKGTSAVQFIVTSSIVIHTLEILEDVYLNIFSCKTFDPKAAEKFAIDWFGAKTAKVTFIERG